MIGWIGALTFAVAFLVIRQCWSGPSRDEDCARNRPRARRAVLGVDDARRRDPLDGPPDALPLDGGRVDVPAIDATRAPSVRDVPSARDSARATPDVQPAIHAVMALRRAPPARPVAASPRADRAIEQPKEPGGDVYSRIIHVRRTRRTTTVRRTIRRACTPTRPRRITIPMTIPRASTPIPMTIPRASTPIQAARALQRHTSPRFSQHRAINTGSECVGACRVDAMMQGGCE